MTNSAGESGNTGNPSSEAGPRDGTLDFSSYSLAQLQDLQQVIDPQSRPLNHANLLAEIARRSGSAELAPDDGARGRFTRHDGILGWLVAKRHRSPLYGEGAIRLNDSTVGLEGFQRTWLGLAMPASLEIAVDRIRNVAVDGDLIEFEIARRFWLARRVAFRARSTEAAATLAARLPAQKSSGFERRWRDVREYRARIEGLGGWPWSVYALVLANVAIFTVMAIRHGVFETFDIPTLIDWGANLGPATLDGQPWRLITAQFVHANVLHLLSNMWVLFNAGRLARELFGNISFLGIYFGAGVSALLTSLAWDPSMAAVGASGAIFGVLAAFLAFLLRQRVQLPAALLRAYWLSTLVFLLFNIASGMTQPNIDNAAHVGGTLSGFVLGWILARPIDRAMRVRWPVWRGLAAVIFVAGVGALSLWQVRGLAANTNDVTKFLKANEAYIRGEQSNLAEWQQVVGALSAGSMSTAEGARRFRSDILPFWEEMVPKLSDYAASRPGGTNDFASVMADFARLRLRWAKSIVTTLDGDATQRTELNEVAKETDRVQSQIERLQLRAGMEYRPRALKHSLLINRIRSLANPLGWKCVLSPPFAGRRLAEDDSAGDGPAMAREIGCRAQRLFEQGDYRELESLMRDKSAHLNDLPDGSSSLGAIFGSLSTQIFYGGYQLDALLGRTADWRRTVEDPLMAEFVEVLIFQQWAWSARGQSGANEVSAQQWYFFSHRTEMAAAGLRAIEATGQKNPIWHDLSIDIALDQSEKVPTIRAIFDRGIERFPTYYPLYAGMLRVLMPRWHGSYEDVDRLIETVTHRTIYDQDTELYARLYWEYFVLEMDSTNIFRDGRAGWNNLDIGFDELEKRYPRSDYLLNAHAVMACVAGDPATYAELRPMVTVRMSESAWSDGWSLTKCDGQMQPPR